VVPPSEFANVRPQLIAPLRTLSSALSDLSDAFGNATCQREASLGLGCNRSNKLLTLGVTLQRRGAAAGDAPEAYKVARARAQSLFADRHMPLPAYPAGAVTDSGH
jgi:hypothetical protein